MVNEQYQKSKQQLAFSRKQVEKAGRIFRKKEGDFEFATEVIQNYRAAHLYPLTIIKNLVWKHVKKLHLLESATIVRRLKRLPTIIDKLQRETLDGNSDNAINLKRMHDIGGCRVILDSLDHLNELNNSLDSSRTVHSVKSYDYIKHPKATGYRGIHRVYKSYNNLESHDYKGFQIEVQLRTRLQHLWATTVEIVDIIEKETLKTNPKMADTDWKRLFFIMGEFLAVKDGAHQLTQQQTLVYTDELAALNKKLAAFHKLDAFNRAFQLDEIKNKSKNTGFALLVHNTETQEGRVFLYAPNKKQQALTHYAEHEKQTQNNVLLVAGSDLKSIEKAYPNYLNDTSEFLSEFSRILLA
ncbi:RelA/SpoT domain-containing protein [Pseudoalteromonas shioyasakiensis]|uniref:RelA/SpoT domain-containing protein n=1 Tax=Pseudoalteromonas shioyasakiensis TaxID=1190813 RepID=UPI0021192EFA|nr:RelA/SpoT domain-containing protein [Pseudoalteromonas shioyasakiensis]MCQ8879666.1 RelA/SpoT domain-containing protein [Pseudoalteromonas shioyasakiensis]